MAGGGGRAPGPGSGTKRLVTKFTRAVAACATLGAIEIAAAPVSVMDDSGRTVVLASPARRIVSLAPHTTETLFAAGAGDRIVGTVAFADHPAAARTIPRVGDSALLDMERIVSLKPDLIVVWLHGNSENHLAKLRTLGIPIFQDVPRKLTDIPGSIMRLGALAGTEREARQAADAFTARLAELRRRYAGRSPVPLFFQVWKKPLLTINGTQIISDVIRLCGGKNLFEDARPLVPSVDVEAVVSANPEAIVATGKAGELETVFGHWRKLANLRATASGNLVLVESDALGRHSPRVLDGAALLCEELERVRARRRP